MSAPICVVHAATMENLPRFLGFIDDVCADLDADSHTKYALRLAVEEICINLIDYGYRGRPPGPIELIAQDHDDRVTLVIRDRSPPFDPTFSPAPDLTSDAEHRMPGGLGWYLVKQLFDEIRYAADTPAGNVLTIVKRKAK
jgi:serine/threonine-protein kinase RsbW